MTSERQQDDEVKRRRARLEAAITPKGSGSGYSGRREVHMAPDFPLQSCDFKKNAMFDSLPIEQACFVLLGFEPPPLQCLRFVQDTYNPSREPTWVEPPDYDTLLSALSTSINHGNVSMRRIRQSPYETQHVLWPELIRWARSKSCAIPAELEDIVAKMEPVASKPTGTDTESASRKRWTPEFIAEVQAYRDANGIKKTALKFKISVSRVKQLTAAKTHKQKTVTLTNAWQK